MRFDLWQDKELQAYMLFAAAHDRVAAAAWLGLVGIGAPLFEG